MSDGVWAALIGAAGLLVGGFVGPHVTWGIEKKRLQLARRAELIKSWREGLLEWEERQAQAENDGTTGPDIRRELWFMSLEQFLSPEDHRLALDFGQPFGPFGQPREPAAPYRSEGGEKIAAEITRIANEWGLH